MKPKLTMTAVAAAFAAASLFGAAPLFAADAHSHEHQAEAHALELNQGKKWTTDAPLRTGMERIRDTLAPELKAIHSGKLKPAQYGALAKRIDTEVAGIVQNCKLEPEADANLHIVLAELMAGTEAMHGKEPDTKPAAGAVKVMQALDSYAKYFDHPGWKGLKH